MNWEAIAAISETISSIAVIVSLVYLARQIHQSNKMSQSHTRIELRHLSNFEVGELVDYPEIWLLMWKDKLAPEEQSRLHSFLIGAIRYREFIWRQHAMDLLDTPTFEYYIRVIPQILGFERTGRWWQDYSQTGTFDPEFVEYVNDMLAKTPKAPLRQMMESL